MSSIGPTASKMLVPRVAVVSLYRRYLKAAIAVPNPTIRLLLLQQIRTGFRRHRLVLSNAAQRELIQQSFKDLEIIEDPRHSRTLYVNKYGMVSCLEWEVRRTEWHFHNGYEWVGYIIVFLLMCVVYIILTSTKSVTQYDPALTELVDYMADRLECPDDPSAVPRLRNQQTMSSIESLNRQRDLEGKILSTFTGAVPGQRLPNLFNPSARDEKMGVTLKG